MVHLKFIHGEVKDIVEVIQLTGVYQALPQGR